MLSAQVETCERSEYDLYNNLYYRKRNCYKFYRNIGGSLYRREYPKDHLLNIENNIMAPIQSHTITTGFFDEIHYPSILHVVEQINNFEEEVLQMWND